MFILEEDCLMYAKYVNKLKDVILFEHWNTLHAGNPSTFTPVMAAQVAFMSPEEKKLLKKIIKKQKKTKTDEDLKEL